MEAIYEIMNDVKAAFALHNIKPISDKVIIKHIVSELDKLRKENEAAQSPISHEVERVLQQLRNEDLRGFIPNAELKKMLNINEQRLPEYLRDELYKLKWRRSRNMLNRGYRKTTGCGVWGDWTYDSTGILPLVTKNGTGTKPEDTSITFKHATMEVLATIKKHRVSGFIASSTIREILGLPVDGRSMNEAHRAIFAKFTNALIEIGFNEVATNNKRGYARYMHGEASLRWAYVDGKLKPC